MKFGPRLLVLSLALISFHLRAQDADSQKTQPNFSVIKEGLSPHFLAVASKLEVGGASFIYAEQEDTLGAIADILDTVLKSVPVAEGVELPPGFSFRDVIRGLGLDRLKASGASSRALPDGRYHSQTFAYIPQGRKGLMTYTGGPPEPFLLHELAPRGTDLVLEFPLHTKDYAKEGFTTARDWMPKAELKEFDKMVNQKQAPLGLSAREIMEKLGARVALIARLNPTQRISAGQPGLTFPGFDAALVIERLEWALDPLKEQFLPMLNNPQAPVEVKDQDGILSMIFRNPVAPAPMDFKPALWYDAKKGRLIVATRPAYLEAILGSEDKLARSAEFEKAWQGMPNEGNGCLYASPRLLSSVMDMILQSLEQPNMDASTRTAMKPMITAVSNHLQQPQAFCYANLPEGSYGAANSILPVGGSSSTLSTLTTLSIISSLAVPTFGTIQGQADQMKISSNGKQLGTALNSYATEHEGKYPKKIEDLVKAGALEDETLLTVRNPATKEVGNWMYDATLTKHSPDTAILLATPFTFKRGSKEKRIVVRKNNYTEIIDEITFKAQSRPSLE